jgi:predicted nucleic acid-binding Zn ribbon protein
MPIYVYEVVLPDGSGGEQFELMQSMSAEALTVHPETGQPIRRIPTAAAVAGRWSEMKTSQRLSDRNLAAKGFTKYTKTDTGRYEKTTGTGPDVISRPPRD